MRILFAISFLNVITAFQGSKITYVFFFYYWLNFFYLAFKVLSLKSLTDETAASRILNGISVVIGEFPYVVAIKVEGKFRCGGFIYNERWVVTAASCVNGFQNVLDRVTVEAGIVSLQSPELSQQLIRIESFHLYDSYNESLTGPLHDLALIQVC